MEGPTFNHGSTNPQDKRRQWKEHFALYEHLRSPRHPRIRGLGMQTEKREYSRGDNGVGPPSAIRQAEVCGCAVSTSHCTRARKRTRERGAAAGAMRYLSGATKLNQGTNWTGDGCTGA